MSRPEGQGQVAVIGLSRFGQSLALALLERGCRVLGIDRDTVLVQRLSSTIPTVALDATDEGALREVDIAGFNTVVVAVGEDFESNLMTTVALKNLGVRHVICLSGTDYEREILLRVGADRVIELEFEAGRRLAMELMLPSSEDQVPLGSSHHVVTLPVPLSLAGQRLAQTGLSDRPQEIILLAIQRGDESMVWPSTDTVLLDGDLLVILQTKGAKIDLGDLS